jgi:endonuclease G, mitochondrial
MSSKYGSLVSKLVNFQSINMFFKAGFRWGNTLFLLAFFVVIGLVLHQKGQTKSLVTFWNNLKNLLRSDNKVNENATNPYKNPEPDVVADTIGTVDVATDRVSTEASAHKNNPTNDQQNNVEGATVYDFEQNSNFFLPAIGSNDQIIRHAGYVLRYREQYEQADWVAYKLTADEARAYMSRDGQKFMPDRLVKTGSAVTADYTKSGYDRGHLAPAGDFNLSLTEKTATFFMSNISPQKPYFNRGIWSDLENKFRDWAQRDEAIYVITGPVLKPNLETIGKYNDVAVPEQFYKIALCLTDKKPRMIGFLMNNETSNESLKSFVVSVDTIERLTGIDFFNRLPDSIENKLESKSVVDDWFSRFGR